VQQLVGRRIATTSESSSQGVLRPSRPIVYDTHEALVFFLLDEVDVCMDEFKKVWESVSKIVVIAREGTLASLLCSCSVPPNTRISRKYGKSETVGGRAATTQALYEQHD